MWKWTQKDENRPAPMGSPVPPVRVIPPEESLQAVLGLQSVECSDPDVTRIGKSVVIKGDISGGGSLYLDGELEGNVELNGSTVALLSGLRDVSAPSCKLVASRCKAEWKETCTASSALS
jgi:hypothetical protein